MGCPMGYAMGYPMGYPIGYPMGYPMGCSIAGKINITAAVRLIGSFKCISCPSGFPWVSLACLWLPLGRLWAPLAPFGATLGSLLLPWGDFGLPLAVLWGPFRPTFGFFGSSGVTLGSLWVCFGVPLAPIGLPRARPWPGRDLSAFGEGKVSFRVHEHIVWYTEPGPGICQPKWWQQLLLGPLSHTRRGPG